MTKLNNISLVQEAVVCSVIQKKERHFLSLSFYKQINMAFFMKKLYTSNPFIKIFKTSVVRPVEENPPS